MSRLRVTLVGMLSVAILAAVASPAPGYVPNTIDFVDGEAVTIHWPNRAFPVPVRVTPGLTTDITDDSDRAALDSALATWSNVPGSSAAVFVEREQDVEAGVADDINAVEFSNDPALDGAQFVAITFFVTSDSGRVFEADMLVNDREIGFTTEAGSDVGLDFETAMLKEFGKFLGLANSPVGGFNSDGDIDETSAIMYGVARGIGETARVLEDDDIAGIHAIYPQQGANFGAIRGTITRNGNPVFGAHVVAHDPIQDILVGAVTLPDGSYEMAGLPPGVYLMEVLPLGSPVPPAALGGIFTREAVDTTFTRAFFNTRVLIGRGQTVSGQDLEVS